MSHETTPDGVNQPQSGLENSAVERVNELELQLKAAREEQLRLLAEMDNQRKRLQRDVESARKFGLERLMSALIPVADSLEAGLKAPCADVSKAREGMELTLQLLNKAFEANGLTTLDPTGQTFDPESHQAMSVVDAPEHKPGSIVLVFQKGYRLNERLLRPAMVAIAKEIAHFDDHA